MAEHLPRSAITRILDRSNEIVSVCPGCQNDTVDKERILEILREHEPELKAAGLIPLRVFGSVARGENASDFDVELLFDCDESEPGRLLRAYGFQERVAEMIGAKVHLSSARHLRPLFRDRVLREAVVVF